MAWWEAVLLGVVEGLTEYLPVSSTGHLVLAQRALGIGATEQANAFAICIQAGAILAVLGLYWRRVRQVLAGVWGRVTGDTQPSAGWHLAVNLLAAFLPAAVVGLLLDDWIEQWLFGLWPIVFAWGAGGIAILALSTKGRQTGAGESRAGLDDLTWRRAVVIGLLQCAALWPGTSRSLVTILGGLLVGLELTAAVEFSFLLGVMTLLAATAYKSLDAGPVMLAHYGWPSMLLGAASAWAAAVVAVRWMIRFLQRYGMNVFGYYRIALALLVAALLASGRLQP